MLLARPGMRVPGVWDSFEIAVRAVLGQQLTFVDSKSVIARLVRTFGRPIKTTAPGLTYLFPRPEIIAAANLSSIGMPPARAETLRALARATCEGKLNPAACKSLDEIVLRLCAIPGMGRRRANYIAMRAFGEPDAFPSSDLGLRRVLTGRSDGLHPKKQFLESRGKLAPVASLCSDPSVGCRPGSYYERRTRALGIKERRSHGSTRRDGAFRLRKSDKLRKPRSISVQQLKRAAYRSDAISMRGRGAVFRHRLSRATRSNSAVTVFYLTAFKINRHGATRARVLLPLRRAGRRTRSER